MALLHNYDPSRVTFSFMGIDVQGFQDGTFIECERNEDGFSTHVGSTGDVTRIRNLNRTGKITLTLMAQSPSNDLLLARALDDEQIGLIYGPILIKDLNTLNQELARANQAWIVKIPKIERAKEASPCVWVFECTELKLTPSGNVF